MALVDQENHATAQKIRQHHAAMVKNLAAQVARLADTVGQDNWQAARDALAAHVRKEILPHAKAEEATIYAEARARSSLSALIDAMTLEHRHIAALTEEIANAPSALAALQAGAGLASLFAAHAQGENDVILPPLEEDPNVQLDRILHDMHHELTQAAPSEAQAPAAPDGGNEPIFLDVREIPHAQRHTIIFGLVAHLNPAQRLVLSVDHDPLPLRYQLEAQYGERLNWVYEAEGPREWRVVLTVSA